MPKLRVDYKRSQTNAYTAVKGGIIAQTATVLTQAKEGIPTAKNGPPLKLQVFNGVKSLTHLLAENIENTYCEFHYQHSDSIDEFYSVIAGMSRQDLQRERKASQYSFYSIELDEPTDNSHKSVLTAFLCYLNCDRVLGSSFLEVRELFSTDAGTIFEAAQDILQEHRLPVQDMIGIATDGASVMTGVHTGVVTRFKAVVPGLKAVHCMAHRLQPANEKAADSVPYITKYIAVLNVFAKSLKYSPKLLRYLETSKELTGTKANKIKQVFFTRWLSFTGSVQALAGCISPVISALQATAVERGPKSRATLYGVMDQIATVKFLLMTHFLADAIGVIGLLSTSLQASDLTFTTAKINIDGTICAIQSFATVPGPFMKEIKAALPDVQHQTGYFTNQGHDFKDSQSQHHKFQEPADLFVQEMVRRLEIAYPDSRAMMPFEIFSPKDLKLQTDEDARNNLAALCEEYASHGINEAAAQIEWSIAHQIMLLPKFQNMNLETCVTHILDPNTFPNLGKLASIGLVLPTTSVNCELGISALNTIKSENRNLLTISHLHDLMWIYLESPSLDEFDFERAFDIWASEKKRHGLCTLVKRAEKLMK